MLRSLERDRLLDRSRATLDRLLEPLFVGRGLEWLRELARLLLLRLEELPLEEERLLGRSGRRYRMRLGERLRLRLRERLESVAALSSLPRL